MNLGINTSMMTAALRVGICSLCVYLEFGTDTHSYIFHV